MMRNCHYFEIEFLDKKKFMTGRLYSTCNNEILMDLGSFKGLTIAPNAKACGDYITSKKFIDVKKGDIIKILDVEVTVLKNEFETITEYNDFCDRKESEEANY